MARAELPLTVGAWLQAPSPNFDIRKDVERGLEPRACWRHVTLIPSSLVVLNSNI